MAADQTLAINPVELASLDISGNSPDVNIPIFGYPFAVEGTSLGGGGGSGPPPRPSSGFLYPRGDY